MYIKNQQFKDEDTLFEVLFDFEIGEPSPYMQGVIDNVVAKIDSDKAFFEHLDTLEEEDRLELYDDVKREQIVKALRRSFTLFVVEKASFFGVDGKDRILLYSIDLY